MKTITIEYILGIILGILLFGGMIIPTFVTQKGYRTIPFFLLGIVFVYAPWFSKVMVDFSNYRFLKRRWK